MGVDLVVVVVVVVNVVEMVRKVGMNVVVFMCWRIVGGFLRERVLLWKC